MAALPASKAMVGVGPPLFWTPLGSRPGGGVVLIARQGEHAGGGVIVGKVMPKRNHGGTHRAGVVATGERVGEDVVIERHRAVFDGKIAPGLGGVGGEMYFRLPAGCRN